MPRKARCQNQSSDSRVRGRNLYRDWSGKRFAEDDERTVRRAFDDIGRQLSIAQRLVGWVREQLNRAVQSQLICQSSQELSRAVHARQKDNRSGFGRVHPGNHNTSWFKNTQPA